MTISEADTMNAVADKSISAYDKGACVAEGAWGPPAERLPLFACAVPAGFPSPADDYLEDTLDLKRMLIAHPAATFFMRADCDSAIDADIRPGDILVVDRSLKPHKGSVIVAVADGEMTLKRMPGSAKTQSDDATEVFEVWGVVTYVIHPVE
jgi:DNA polymerase V